MSAADIDARVIDWLRDGEMLAPPQLATDVHDAIRRVTRRRRPAWSLRLPAGQRRAVVGILLAAAVATLGLIGLAGGFKSNPIEAPAPSASLVPSGSPASAIEPSPTTDLDQYLITPAPPTLPPAGPMEAGGFIFDLPAGWYDPPSPTILAVISAFDSRKDPPGGVYMVLVNNNNAVLQFPGYTFGTAYRFRDANTGLRASGVNAASNAVDEANRQFAMLQASGSAPTIRNLALPIGKAVQIEWDVAPGTVGSLGIHVRAVFVGVDGVVVRIDLLTTTTPTKADANLFLSILESARLGPGATAAP